MPTTIQPKSKVINSSAFSLKSTAFDQLNYRSGGAPPNDTITADTPKGVLGGSVATVSAINDYESAPGLHSSAILIGLYSDQSEGNPFENAPAAASGVVGIYMSGGLFDLYLFECENANSPYASILASYTYMAALYASPFGLVTNQQPTTLTAPYSGGINTILGYVTAIPTSSNLRLGIKLIL